MTSLSVFTRFSTVLYRRSKLLSPATQSVYSKGGLGRFVTAMAARDFNVEHNLASKEFCIKLDTSVKAYLQYETLDDGTVDLYHTLVPTSHRGQGIAKDLAKAALDHFSNEGTKFKLSCTYLQKYVQDYPNEVHRKMIAEDLTG